MPSVRAASEAECLFRHCLAPYHLSFRRVFRQAHEDLGCASYLVADGGEAAVVDPKWDVEDYLARGRAWLPDLARPRDPQSRGSRLRQGAPAEGDRCGHSCRPGPESLSSTSHRQTAMLSPSAASASKRWPHRHRPEHTAYVISDAARGESPGSSSPATRSSLSATSRGPDPAVEPRRGRGKVLHPAQPAARAGRFRRRPLAIIGGSLCGGAGTSEKPGTTIASSAGSTGSSVSAASRPSCAS